MKAITGIMLTLLLIGVLLAFYIQATWTLKVNVSAEDAEPPTITDITYTTRPPFNISARITDDFGLMVIGLDVLFDNRCFMNIYPGPPIGETYSATWYADEYALTDGAVDVDPVYVFMDDDRSLIVVNCIFDEDGGGPKEAVEASASFDPTTLRLTGIYSGWWSTVNPLAIIPGTSTVTPYNCYFNQIGRTSILHGEPPDYEFSPAGATYVISGGPENYNLYLRRKSADLGKYSLNVWARDTSGNQARYWFELTTAPTIADVVQSQTADEVDPDEAVNITAINVADNVGVDVVLLRFSTDNVTFTNVTMYLVNGTNNYTGLIPGQTAGTYVTYKVYANDTSGNFYETTLYAYRVKEVAPPPYDPTASFTYEPPTPLVNQIVSFNASASYDPDGEIVGYEWDFGDGAVTVEDDSIVEHAYASADTYTVTLTVTDDDGSTGTVTADVTVHDISPPPEPPVASSTCSPSAPGEGETVSFNASASYDPDGEIVGYEWDFGDGTTGTGLTVNHTYTEPGTYIATLTVRDATGDESTHSVTITVLPAEAMREPRSVYIVAEVAVIGAALTAAATALASFGGLGQSFNSAVSRLPIPEKLKDFLKLYGEKMFETVDKAKLEALEKAPFITKGELAALGTSVLIMSIVFGFVEANGLPRFLKPSVLAAVIPSTLLSVCLVSIVGELTEALCARTCRVYRQFRLWMYGLGAFLISGLLFLFPFASPGITRYQSDEISNETKGLIVLSKMLVLLTLTIPFVGLFMLGFKIVGDAGLLLTLMTVCYSLVPLKPLVGKAVFDYRKEVSVIALVSTGILFYSCYQKLLPQVAYLAVGAVSLVLAVITLSQLGKAHPK